MPSVMSDTAAWPSVAVGEGRGAGKCLHADREIQAIAASHTHNT